MKTNLTSIILKYKHISIPTIHYTCSRSTSCCKRIFVPLTLAYARTIHKFQGMSAGPVDKGKLPNPYSCIICDPDTKEAEALQTGLFYTAVSRSTTFGNDLGENSAIFFMGNDFNAERIRNINKKKNSTEYYANFYKRQKWVDYLKKTQNQMIYHKKIYKI